MLNTIKTGVKDTISDIKSEEPANSPTLEITDTRSDNTERKLDSSLRGMRINRVFTKEGTSPYDAIEWEKRDASIVNSKGELIFSKKDVEVPKSWSMLATNIVASKYFYGTSETKVNETSIREVIHRVARTISDWGLEDGYFASPEDAESFYNELSFLCLNQFAAFNSPVWFNVGLNHIYKLTSNSQTTYCWNEEKETILKAADSYKSPQASACFIQACEDTMDDIMKLAHSEAMLFKYGSGTGSDLSTLRSSREKLSGGGTPSGPLSFMRVFDQIAGVIKSGGKTRRAAKMQSLKVDHPDIMEFITCKYDEEQKAKALIDMGYDSSMDGEAYSSVAYQNANLSVRVYDDFMKSAISNGIWHTKSVTTGEKIEQLNAKDILMKISKTAHACGDPGVQYDTTINKWHTCPESGRINASNPCSEYMFIDNSACNLASINLMKFFDDKQIFNTDKFRHVVKLFITAQEILVDRAGYPTRDIAMNSHKFRPLGLGFANLGALVMSLGLPYDSDEGRSVAGAIAALMTGTAYETSSELAAIKEPFEEYSKNGPSMRHVMQMHRDAVDQIEASMSQSDILAAAKKAWDSVLEKGAMHGFRNAQVTVLAPTGTIGFMMDCDTTGIEPDIALVKYKQLAGGGTLKLTNHTVPLALNRLGYTQEQLDNILKHIEETDTIEGATDLQKKHLPVFDCAFKPQNGTRFINYSAHLKMMAAVQPFISGAISKTVNMPQDATVEDVLAVYIDGWKLGLKAVAIYREGSKGVQPVSTGKKTKSKKEPLSEALLPGEPQRKRMSETRLAITHKFDVGGHEGYLSVGLYDDGTPGELFITMAKEGSMAGGIMDAFGIAISMCLQHGVPLNVLTDKFSHTRFEPSGYTKNPKIGYASSLVDYIFRWLALTFPDGKCNFCNIPEINQITAASTAKESDTEKPQSTPANAPVAQLVSSADAPLCDHCGAITYRNGACYVCRQCGTSAGCS
ncbi:MAG: vitamin B12-dependent ribonucleotide reductase [Lentisphaerae bacterium]|nr:vitamin B12-dependent ribonucleotide reductase [Lentisphaerota bacterium]